MPTNNSMRSFVSYLLRIGGIQCCALEPLFHVVRVLAQNDAAKELWPPLHEAFEAADAQLKINLICNTGETTERLL